MDSHKRKSNRNRRNIKTYDTSVILHKIHCSMIRDLNPLESSWFKDPRSYDGPGYKYWKSYDFKKMAQLQHFFKRIVLPTDPDNDVIETLSINKFRDSQETFGIRRHTLRSKRVIERASAIVADVLGEFDYNEFFRFCRFGKKSAKDLPLEKSYLDNRVNCLNGTPSQLEWFKAACNEDIHFHRAVRHGLKKAYTVDSLDLKAVPKAFDKKRTILPDSTVGGFLSAGLGRLIRSKLEGVTHIKLASAESIHKYLAKASSVSGTNATLDMKSASDSFVWEHITMLTPESWWPILETVRIGKVNITYPDGTTAVQELRSYMLMGSGHTFPLQTLLFYAICKATLELLGSRARVYVYGDDIILPSKYASYIVDIVYDLGFTINEDKSFIDGPFRESCGGDYHHGVDVRPFMPEHFCEKLHKNEYTEFLNKLYNGFLRRWEYAELPETLDLIITEILAIWGEVYPIPEEYPETCGLYYIPQKYSGYVRCPILKDSITYYFVLSSKSRRRKPTKERIYYWYWLHSHNSSTIMLDPLKWDADGSGSLDHRGLSREPLKGSSKPSWIFM